MNDISKETLTTIKEQAIVPHKKRYFLFKRATVWGLFAMSVVLGSIAASAAIFQVKNTEWDLFHYFRHSVFEFVLLFIPYFWGAFIIGFSVVAYHYFRLTQSGYRYRAASVVALSVLLSVIGGAGIYHTGLSERLESAIEKTLPFYRGVCAHQRMVWMSPDKGLLAGKLNDQQNEGLIRFKDLEGNEWNVMIEGATWCGALAPEPDLERKLIGTRTGEDGFRAQEVRPWFCSWCQCVNGMGAFHDNKHPSPGTH